MLRYKEHLDLEVHKAPLMAILGEVIAAQGPLSQEQFNKLLRRNPRDGEGLYSRSDLIFTKDDDDKTSR